MRPTLRRRHRQLGSDQAHRWNRDHPAVHGRVYPRVLVEAADGAEGFARVRLLESHGYDAMWCPGPTPGHSEECPLVTGDGCPLVDEADVVVTSLDLKGSEAREVLSTMARTRPEVPVVVETSRAAAEAWADLLQGHGVVMAPTTTVGLLDAVSTAMERRADDIRRGAF
jgi:hypothetical protein